MSVGVPSTPPVSGPGPQSARTDLAPGQPVRVPTGLPYGEHKQLEQAQSAVSLPALSQPGGTPPPSGAGGAGSAPANLPMPPDILQTLSHPTQRPGEPVTAPSGNLGGGSKSIPMAQAVQTLEHLIALSDKVPDNVMKLYQKMRVEANGG